MDSGQQYAYCSCCTSSDPGVLALYPDGMVTDGCGGTSCAYWPNPTACDGVDPVAPTDEGCLNDECGCEGLDADPFPIRYSAGRVETRPMTLFELPAIGGLSLGLEIVWGSELSRIPAYKRPGDTQPTMHGITETLHFLGDQWIDNWADRLVIGGTMSPANIVTWQGFGRTVTFVRQGVTSIYLSNAGVYRLEDRGAGSPRWVITEAGAGAGPSQQWGFDEFTFPGVNGQSYRVANLARRAITAGPSDFVGYYSLTVVRTSSSDDRIVRIYDSFGRELRYTYSALSIGGSSATAFYRLASVGFAPSSTAASVPIATFQYTKLGGSAHDDLGLYLDRVDYGAGYRRFRYMHTLPDCGDCRGMLTDVIAPTTALTSTAIEADLLTTEVVQESHDYELTGDPVVTGVAPRALASSGPGQSFAYVYGTNTATQYDLTQQGGACGSCQSGFQCYSVSDGGDGQCYVTTGLTNDSLKLNTSHNSSAGTVTSQVFTSTGLPKRSTDASNIKTTYGYGTNGALRCLVRGDDDDEAFQTPGSPDSSECAGPVGSQIVKASRSSGAASTQIPSISSGHSMTRSESVDFPSRRTTVVEDGYTHDIARSEAHSVRTQLIDFDAQWRETRVDGPLTNANAFDVHDFSYYGSTGDNNAGELHQITSYVGASSGSTCPSCTVLVTTYDSYDAFGVPGKVTYPAGDYMTFSPSLDRLKWTIRHYSSTLALMSTAEVTMYPDGNVRSYLDPDGVCTTYEYTSASGYVGAPTVIARGATCLTPPINQNSGEVEIRTYIGGDPRRLASITRRLNGVTELSYSGFSYDLERRLVQGTTADSAQPYQFGFTNGVPSSTTAPSGPAAGTWKTSTDIDAFGRPAHMWRWLSGSSNQTYKFEYQSSFSPHPTRLVRGKDAASTSTTDFVYDDFGDLVESNVPEQGLTTFEFDGGRNMIKERVGVGTSLVRTAVKTYDSLGRLTFVDNDIEHPVTCGVSPALTKIQDEEYKYDTCAGDAPSGVTCDNALGRLTISRALLHCSIANALIKRGRWYSYDEVGRTKSVSFATVTGGTIGAPATMATTYSAGSRITRQDSPLNSQYGTIYGLTLGRVASMRRPASATPDLAVNFAYRAQGPLKSFDTYVVVADSPLRSELVYRSDDTVTNLSWKIGATYYVNQSFTFTPAGLIQTRHENASLNNAILNSRYYAYDSLLRLTCEARGSGSTHPTSGDCVTSSARLRALVTFHDGASATQPPDTRNTSYLKANLYTNGLTDTSSYSSGSGRVVQITRAANNHLVLGYDALGRRSYDYDDFDATRSRRDYAYLPNGQLASVTGQTPAGATYTESVNYDAEGRPATISYYAGFTTDTYEFFWDDADRLIAAQLIFPGFPTKTVQWHYNYLGDQLIAATRSISLAGGSTTVQRFWFLTDERGLIYSVLTNAGVENFRARWDASGWRTIEVQTGGAQDMWVPFGLPGQLILEQTATNASGSGFAHTRPPLALNGRRVYDPLLGGFLQPDAADARGRLSPEQYLGMRGSPTVFEDISGDQSSEFYYRARLQLAASFMSSLGFGDDCPASDIAAATADAYLQIALCVDGACSSAGGLGGGEFKRRWLAALGARNYKCPARGASVDGDYLSSGRITSHGYYASWDGKHEGQAVTDVKSAVASGTAVYTTFLAPSAFKPEVTDPNQCPAQVIAHEALHVVTYTTSAVGLVLDDSGNWGDALVSAAEVIQGNGNDYPKGSQQFGEEPFVNDAALKCVKCTK